VNVRLIGLSVVLAFAGCAHALKEPPSLEGLGSQGARHAPEEVESLLGRASSLFASRDLRDVRQSAQLWLDAAAADGSRTEGLLGAASALVWLTEHETEPAARLRAATQAVQAAQWCGRIEPAAPACHYWLGAALGVQARERPSTGLSALPQIEESFKRAAATDPTIEEGGPDRALALLYLRAPGWPAGPGDPDLGLDHARKAVALKPDYPPNHLSLGEAFIATGDPNKGHEAYRMALELARKRASSGDPDAREWVEEAERALARVIHERP